MTRAIVGAIVPTIVGTIVVVLVIVLAILAAIAAATPAGRDRHFGGGEWWSEPIRPEARAALRRYARNVIAPTLRAPKEGESSPMALDRALRVARGTRDDLVSLRRILSSSTLAGTAAGVGEGRRAERHARAVLDLLPEERWPLLDIGCGDGSVTAAIAAGAPAGHSSVFCVEPGAKPDGFPGGVGWACEGRDGSLPFPDGKFAAVTALMSLHHVDRRVLPRLAEEIARVTRPAGTLVIREHDVRSGRCGLSSKAARQYLDWVHILFDLAEGAGVDEVAAMRSDYRTPAEWDALFAPHFTRVRTVAPRNHPMCAYYAVYRRR